MSKLTRSKIAYDLNISPHYLRVKYPSGEVLYYFSSELYKTKFGERQAEAREKIKKFMFTKYEVNTQFDELADLNLYTSIEKRGFLIYKGGEKFECLAEVTFGGEIVTEQKSNEQ